MLQEKKTKTPQHLVSRLSEIQLWKIIKTCEKKKMLLLPLIFYNSKRFRVKAAMCGEIKLSTSLLFVRKETSANEVFRVVFALCFPLFDPGVLSKNPFLGHLELTSVFASHAGEPVAAFRLYIFEKNTL